MAIDETHRPALCGINMNLEQQAVTLSRKRALDVHSEGGENKKCRDD
jgi:hypothetical protein